MHMRDSEPAIKGVQDAFEDYRQSHDYLNDMITVWASVKDSQDQDRLRASWSQFLVFFYNDRTVFKYKKTALDQ